MKSKNCAVCNKEFMPFRMAQKVCSPKCATKYSKALKAQERRKLRDRKELLKSRSDWLKEVQIEFNKYIRARDENLPCISCQRFHVGKYDAGHYRTVKAAPHLRFDENNVHKQCNPCNTHLSGNLINYRMNLINKIGLEAVEKIESDNAPKHYTIDDLKELKAHYKAKLKGLKNV